MLAPVIFTVLINNLDNANVKFHFYADDTIIYVFASSISHAVNECGQFRSCPELNHRLTSS